MYLPAPFYYAVDTSGYAQSDLGCWSCLCTDACAGFARTACCTCIQVTLLPPLTCKQLITGLRCRVSSCYFLTYPQFNIQLNTRLAVSPSSRQQDCFMQGLQAAQHAAAVVGLPTRHQDVCTCC